MKVKVGDISANCPQCQAAEFTSLGSDPSRNARLACTRCGYETSRSELLVQIGEKASRQAAESLALLRQRRKPPQAEESKSACHAVRNSSPLPEIQISGEPRDDLERP